jgi:hypothetical protein
MKLLLLLLVWIAAAGPALSQTAATELPKGAVIIERRNLPLGNTLKRALVLWMLRPEKHPTGYQADEPYTCPDYTRGSYYSGPARVSVIDTSTGKVINTVQLEDEENVDVPYSIRKGYYYQVSTQTKPGIEAKPTIIWLRDYNGDGKPLEFAMFDAEACMGLQTTLIGYSPKRDRVIQYPLILRRSGKSTTEKLLWIDYLFSKQPVRPGHWKYEVDYRGRGGELEKWDIRYNAATEQFEGTFTGIPG